VGTLKVKKALSRTLKILPLTVMLAVEINGGALLVKVVLCNVRLGDSVVKVVAKKSVLVIVVEATDVRVVVLVKLLSVSVAVLVMEKKIVSITVKDKKLVVVTIVPVKVVKAVVTIVCKVSVIVVVQEVFVMIRIVSV
jgi:hypothetical protein